MDIRKTPEPEIAFNMVNSRQRKRRVPILFDVTIYRRTLKMLRGGTAPFQIKLADGKAYLKKRDCVGSVREMRKWKTTIIGCYGVLGGN